MKIIFITFIILSFASSAQNLEQILSRHYDAINTKKLKEINTIIIHSRLIQNSEEFPVTIYHKKPLKIRAEINGPAGKSIQIFNGESGWNIVRGKSYELNADEIKRLKDEADFGGLLNNYKEKGYKINLKGNAFVNGKKAYELILIKSPNDSLTVFLDAENYLLIRTVTMNNIVTDISRYKNVDNIPFAFFYESRGKNYELSQQVDSIKVNRPLSDSLFNK